MNRIKIWLLAITLFQIISTEAQVNWAKNYRYDNFEQIDYSSNLVYTFNQAKVGSNYDLTFFNFKGEQLETIEVPYKTSLKIVACAAVGTNTVFYMIDANTGILLSVDNKGKQIASVDFEDKQSFSYDSYIHDCDGNSFFLSRSFKADKMGHITEKYSMDLKKSWDYTLTPDKGKNKMMLATGGKNGVVLMSQYLKNAFASDGPVSMIFLSPEGKVLSNTPFATLPVNFNPYMMRMLSDGSVFVAADYGKPASTIYPEIPLGLNYMKIKSDGSVVTNVQLEFSKVQTKVGPVKEDGTLLYKEAPGLRVIDIRESGNDIMLVTESFFIKKIEVTTQSANSMATTSNNVDVTLGDIYVLNSNDLELIKAKRIWKPKRMYNMKGFFRGDLSYVAEDMQSWRGFSIHGFIGNNLVIRGFNRGFQYVNTIAEGDSYEDVTKRTYFGKSVGNVGYNMTNIPIESDNRFKAGKVYDEGMMVTATGVLLYSYNVNTRSLQFSFINF